MAASLAVSPPSESPSFDKWVYLRSANKIGKACRNRAMELICICRVFSFSRAAEQSFSQDASLNNVLQVCDKMLARMAKTDKMDKVKPDHWIQLAKKELETYEEKYHPSKQNSHESVKERMNRAMHRDREESRPVLRHFSTRRTKRNDPPKVVKFHLLRSIPDPKPILVQQAFTDVPSLPEILWNFCRRSENRVTLADNPHFYHHHLRIKSPNTYDDGFTTDPMDYYQDVEDMCVLTNKPGRLFLECGEKSRAFDNVWKTNGIFIFKDVSGKLDGEGNVGAPIQGKPCKWCHVDPLPSQREDWERVQDWREAIPHVLDSQNTKIRITIFTELVATLPN